MKEELNISDFREKLSYWLEKNKVTVFLIIVIIFLAMITIFIVDYVQDRIQVNSSMLAEDIQEKYRDWVQDKEDDMIYEEINNLIDNTISEYPNSFAAERAIYTKGLMSIDSKEWEKAAESFETLVDKWPESYLAAVSLSNLAAIKEEMGEKDEAIKILGNIVANYSDIAPDVAEAIFNLGRLYELSEDKEKAINHYEELNSKFPGSRWNSLAKSRIMILKFR